MRALTWPLMWSWLRPMAANRMRGALPAACRSCGRGAAAARAEARDVHAAPAVPTDAFRKPRRPALAMCPPPGPWTSAGCILSQKDHGKGEDEAAHRHRPHVGAPPRPRTGLRRADLRVLPRPPRPGGPGGGRGLPERPEERGQIAREPGRAVPGATHELEIDVTGKKKLVRKRYSAR